MSPQPIAGVILKPAAELALLAEDNPQALDEYWMGQALVLAKRAAEHGEVPVGAIVVRANQMIGQGSNAPIGACDASAHAEIIALRQAGETQRNYRLPGASLYVTIEPCAMCLGAIVHSRVARVVYGATEPKAGMLDSHKQLLESGCFNHYFEFRGGVLAASCAAIISDFFSARRAQKKSEKNKHKQTQEPENMRAD